jgi:hypothetical protein
LSCLAQRFRHALAIVIAIHYGHVGANKAKWFTGNEKTAALCLHKASGRITATGGRACANEEKSRTHSNCERGEW